MSFHDILLPPQISWGFEGGPEFETGMTVTGSGYEFRNANWDEERGSWDIAHLVKEEHEKEMLFSFFRGRKGRTFSYRYKDWMEHIANRSGFGIGDGVKTVFDLFFTSDDGLVQTLKRIALPVDAAVYTEDPRVIPVSVYNDTVLVPEVDYTVDYRSGRITFNTPPGTDEILTWSGHFHKPCRFNVDKLTARSNNFGLYNFNEVPIIEVRPEEIILPVV